MKLTHWQSIKPPEEADVISHLAAFTGDDAVVDP